MAEKADAAALKLGKVKKASRKKRKAKKSEEPFGRIAHILIPCAALAAAVPQSRRSINLSLSPSPFSKAIASVAKAGEVIFAGFSPRPIGTVQSHFPKDVKDAGMPYRNSQGPAIYESISFENPKPIKPNMSTRPPIPVPASTSIPVAVSVPVSGVFPVSAPISGSVDVQKSVLKGSMGGRAEMPVELLYAKVHKKNVRSVKSRALELGNESDSEITSVSEVKSASKEPFRKTKNSSIKVPLLPVKTAQPEQSHSNVSREIAERHDAPKVDLPDSDMAINENSGSPTYSHEASDIHEEQSQVGDRNRIIVVHQKDPLEEVLERSEGEVVGPPAIRCIRPPYVSADCQHESDLSVTNEFDFDSVDHNVLGADRDDCLNTVSSGLPSNSMNDTIYLLPHHEFETAAGGLDSSAHRLQPNQHMLDRRSLCEFTAKTCSSAKHAVTPKLLASPRLEVARLANGAVPFDKLLNQLPPGKQVTFKPSSADKAPSLNTTKNLEPSLAESSRHRDAIGNEMFHGEDSHPDVCNHSSGEDEFRALVSACDLDGRVSGNPEYLNISAQLSRSASGVESHSSTHQAEEAGLVNATDDRESVSGDEISAEVLDFPAETKDDLMTSKLNEVIHLLKSLDASASEHRRNLAEVHLSALKEMLESQTEVVHSQMLSARKSATVEPPNAVASSDWDSDARTQRQNQTIVRLQTQMKLLEEEVRVLAGENSELKTANQSLKQKNRAVPEIAPDVAIFRSHNEELKEQIDMYKSVIYRLNAELSHYQARFRVLGKDEMVGGAFPDDGPIPSWMVNVKQLCPLLVAYDDVVKEKSDLIKQYEEQLGALKERLHVIIQENHKLHMNVAVRGDSSQVSGDEWQQLTELARLVIEENEVLHEQSQTHERAIADLHKEYRLEITKHAGELLKAEAEKGAMEKRLGEAQLALEQVGRKHETLKKSMDRLVEKEELDLALEKLARDHEAALKKLRGQVDFHREAVQAANKEREKLAIEVTDLTAVNRRLEAELQLTSKSLRRSARGYALLRDQVDTSACKEIAARDALTKVLKVAEEHEADRKKVTELMDTQRGDTLLLAKQKKENERLVLKLTKEQKELKAILQKTVDAANTRLRQQDEEIRALNEKNQQELTELKELVRQKQKVIDRLQKSQREMESEFSDMWKSTRDEQHVPMRSS